MTPDIIKAEYRNGYKIQITFENGKSGIVDFSKYTVMGGVLAKLKDIDFFKRFFVDPEVFVLAWPNHIDIAPEEIYSEATGEPLPHWMADENEYRKAV